MILKLFPNLLVYVIIRFLFGGGMMGRIVKIGLSITASLLFLTACNNTVEYPAKESHLENAIFIAQQNPTNQFIFNEGELTVIIDEFMVKPDTDPTDAEGKEKSEVVYHDIQIKTDGNKYMITGDNDFSLELQRIGDRILMDEDGQRYSTSKSLD